MAYIFLKVLSGMFLNSRFIPVLQIKERRLVKTIQFTPKRYLGDPLNAIRIFNLKGVSELVITDIGATQNKTINFEFLKKLSAQAFVPLTYGGGINSIEDVHELYQLGFDRVLFGQSVITNSTLIEDTARIYGSQSVICSIDIKSSIFKSKYLLTYQGGKKKVRGNNLEKMVNRVISCGAGEILLHDSDRDGTYKGLNHSLIEEISKMSSVPIIACGGIKDIEDAYRAIEAGASAVAAGSLFSFYGKHKAVLINYSVS